MPESTQPESLPNTVVVVDQDGVQHWSSRQSKFVVDGLADGSLREADDAPVPPQGPDLDSGSTNDGSSVGQPDAGDANNGGDDGVAGAETGSGTRKRR